MVARHEMPGKRTAHDPSWRDGLIGVAQRIGFTCTLNRMMRTESDRPSDHTGSLRDGALPCGFSRHFMPGYHHTVPPGQNQTSPSHQPNKHIPQFGCAKPDIRRAGLDIDSPGVMRHVQVEN
jgi:hypothetical protein